MVKCLKPAVSRGAAAFLAAVLVCCVSVPARAQLYTYQTSNLRLVYLDKGYDYVVPHVARCFENSLGFHRRLFHYTPSEQVTVLLHDFNDYGTGGTNTIPWNYLSIGIEPYDYEYETAPTNERMNWVMNHELVHVVATDKAAGADRVFRKMFFGKVTPTAENPLSMAYSYLTSPRWYCPRWYHEGIAVFLETWMAGGIGRVLGGYDEMVFRTMVRDSSYFYDYVGLESEGTTIDFQIGANSYLYGTRFVSYLANRYGPEKVLKWFNRTDDSRRYFASQFEDVYGVSLSDEWAHWIEWEHAWQRANLDSVRRYPLTPYRPVVPAALGSVSRAFADSARRTLYVAMNRPGSLAGIAAIDLHTGAMRTLCTLEGPALYYVCSLAYDAPSGTLFYTTHNSSSWRDIWKVDVRTGQTRRLFAGSRTGDLVINPADHVLWGVQHNNGYSALVRIPPPYKEWSVVLTLKYGKDMFDIDIAPDGKHLTASLIEINGRQQLISLDLEKVLTGDFSYETLYEFENNSPENFVFSPDGSSLFGTTYFTGVSNVVRYSLATRKMEWVTNTETGLFRPMPLTHDSLVAFRYTGAGFLPVMIANGTCEDVSAISYLGQHIVDSYPVVTTWKLAPPSVVNADSIRTFAGEYSSWSQLGLASIYPIVEGYKSSTAIGLRANIQDLIGAQAFTLTGSYSPGRGLSASERIHAGAEMRLWQWKFNASLNGADFYDLFGPTKTSRKGFWLGASYSDYLIMERPKTLSYTLSLNIYGGLERLPDYQNVQASYDRFSTFSGALEFSHLLRTLGSVDYEEGTGWSLNNGTTFVRSQVFPHTYVTADGGTGFLVDHSSLWLRLAAGYSPGARTEPFANFYFGGFGNNWVDYQVERRYREYYSFPGLELNEAGGTTFGKAMLEWTLPPLRFKRLGIPSLYCTWSRLALFSAGLVTNIDRRAIRAVYADAGAQADFKLVLFSHLNSTLSFGYALATGEGRRPSTEFMGSLKILGQ